MYPRDHCARFTNYLTLGLDRQQSVRQLRLVCTGSRLMYSEVATLTLSFVFQLTRQIIRQSRIPESGDSWQHFDTYYAQDAGTIATQWSAEDRQNNADQLKVVLDKVEPHRAIGCLLAEEQYVSPVSSKAVPSWLIQFWTLQYTAMEENSPLNKAYVTAVTRLGLPEQPLPHVPRAVVSEKFVSQTLALQ